MPKLLFKYIYIPILLYKIDHSHFKSYHTVYTKIVGYTLIPKLSNILYSITYMKIAFLSHHKCVNKYIGYNEFGCIVYTIIMN